MDVDQLARVLSVHCEALAIQARVLGMVAENRACVVAKQPEKWTAEDFATEAASLFRCSNSLHMMGS